MGRKKDINGEPQEAGEPRAEAGSGLEYSETEVDLGELGRSLATVVQRFRNGFIELTRRAAPMMRALAHIDWDVVRQGIEDLSRDSREAMAAAASRGWFIGWYGSLSQVVHLVHEIEQLDAEKIDEYLADHYRNHIAELGAAIVARHPGRAAPVQAALTAHALSNEEGYYLSVPVFLAQADGIITEVTCTQTGSQLTKSGLQRDRNQQQYRAALWLQSQLEGDQRALDLIDPILNLHANQLFHSGNERSKDFSGLNRHQVLHGEVSNYGTELNSLKAFSFLAFVALHLPDILESAARRSVTKADTELS